MDLNLILASIGVFLVVIIALVIILLVAKTYLSPSGNVNITINVRRKSLSDREALCSVRLHRKGYSFQVPVAERVLVDNASSRSLKVVERYLIPRRVTLHASKSRTIGVSDASAR